MSMNEIEAIWVHIKVGALRGRKDLQAQGLPRYGSSEKVPIRFKRIDQRKGISSPCMARKTPLSPMVNLAEYHPLPKQRILKEDAHPPPLNVGLNLKEIQSGLYLTQWIKKKDIKMHLTKFTLICGLPPRTGGMTILADLLNFRENFMVRCLPATVVKGEQIGVGGAIGEEGLETMAFLVRIKVLAKAFLTGIHLNTKVPYSTSFPNRILIMSGMHRNRMARLITLLSLFQELFVLVLVRTPFHIRIRMAGFLMPQMDLILDHLSCPAYRQI